MQLDDRIDEVAGAARARVGRPVAVEHRDLGAVFGDHERVRERGQAVALATSGAPRSGFSTTTPGGTFTNAPPARNASCSTVNASGDASEQDPSSAASSSASQVAMPQTRTPLASSSASSAWCTTRPSRTTTRPDALAGLGRDGPAAGRRLDARFARAVSAGTGRYWSRSSSPIRLYRQISSAAVGHSTSARRADGSDAARRQASRGRAEPRAASGSEVLERRHRCTAVLADAPSMLSSMSRESSTAYSIGSVLVIGSMNPLTIIAVACCSVSPRLIR